MNISKIFKIANRPKSKILIENFLSLSVLQVINYLLPLITLPYLTHVIGVELFGVLAIANAIVVYFQTFVDFGFDYTATRDIAKNQHDITAVSRIFWTTIYTKIVLMIISLFILILLILLLPYFREHYLIILITFLNIPGYILFPEWFFQGMEKMKYITILNVVAKVIFTFLIFIIIKEKGDYLFQPVLLLAGYLVAGIASMIIILKRFKVSFYRPSFVDMKQAIKGSYDIFFNQLLPNLYNSLSILLLGYWWSNAVTGIYEAGKKVIAFSEQIIIVLSRTFFPYLANHLSKHNVYVKISLLLSLVFMVILFLGAEFIVRILFATDFEEAKTIIRLLAISPVLFSLINAFGTNFLILVHKERLLRNITLISSLIGMILAIILTYYYKAIGAGLAFLIARSMIGGLCLYYARKIKLRIATV